MIRNTLYDFPKFAKLNVLDGGDQSSLTKLKPEEFNCVDTLLCILE